MLHLKGLMVKTEPGAGNYRLMHMRMHVCTSFNVEIPRSRNTFYRKRKFLEGAEHYTFVHLKKYMYIP